MIIYRYEKPDKGGVFFTYDGINRTNNLKFNDKYLSCCESEKKLKQWFSERKIDVSDCMIVSYDIPIEEILHTKTHLLFPKDYLKRRN